MFHRDHKLNTLSLSVLICAVWIGLFVLVSGWLGRDSAEEQRKALEAALERDITTCYALEGHFPPDLQYLRDHYGLHYDEELFYVDYRPIAANIRPDHVVIERTEAAAGTGLWQEVFGR